MKIIKDVDLEKITGGASEVTGPIISAFVSIIELLQEAGRALGSGIRRISEDNLCPLK